MQLYEADNGYAERHTFNPMMDAAGKATTYTPVLSGRVVAVTYTEDDSNAYAAGVDVPSRPTPGTEYLGREHVNASKTVAPRQSTHDTVEAASLCAAAGDHRVPHSWWHRIGSRS